MPVQVTYYEVQKQAVFLGFAQTEITFERPRQLLVRRGNGESIFANNVDVERVKYPVYHFYDAHW